MEEREWYCTDRDCGTVLGHVVGRELDVSGGVVSKTDGPNLVVTCPRCGKTKIWYSSDKVVRAIYELLDTLVTLFVTRAMSKLSRETLEMMKNIEEE